MARTTLTTGTNDANNTSYATASFTPTAGRLFVAFVMSGGQPLQGTTVAPTAIGQPGLTLSSLIQAKHPAAELQLTCFRGWVTGPVGNNPVTFDFGTQVQRWCAWTVYEFDDIDATANGSLAIATAFPNAVTWLAVSTRAFTRQAHCRWRRSRSTNTSWASRRARAAPTSTPADERAVGQRAAQHTRAGGRRPVAQCAVAVGRCGERGVDYVVAQPCPALDGDGPVGGDEELTPTEKLIRQYEPILFLDPAEQFVPVDAKRYLEHCRLWSTAALSADDAKDSWGLAPGKTFPRSPWAYAGTLVGRPEEAGYFIGNDDVKYASTHEVEFWLEMGGWRDIDGTHAGTVDTNTVNTYADSAEVARQYSDVPELDASKFWYHAEVFDAAKLRQLLGTVESPDLMRILVGLHNPTLLCYYMFFPFHEQHGPDQGCEDKPKDQLVGSCGGDWTCVAVLLEETAAGGELEPTYIGLTGEQIWLPDRHDLGLPYLAHHFDDDKRINLNVVKWSDATVATESGHPRVHVAPGSHAMATAAGAVTGLAFPFNAWPVHCSDWDNDSLVPDLTPSWLETTARS